MNSFLHNLRGFHTYTVFVVTGFNISNSSSRWQQWALPWLFSLASLVIVSTKILLLAWLLGQTFFRPCSTHDQCGFGEYCGKTTETSDYKCYRCPTEFNNDPYCQSFYDREGLRGDRTIDHTVLWFKKDQSWFPGRFSQTDIGCLASLHCNNAGIVMGTEDRNYCDFLCLNTRQLPNYRIISLAFISLLFIAEINKDVKEANIDELLLDRGCTQSSPFLISPFSAAGNCRLSLRIRRHILPWYMACTSIGMIIRDCLSPKDILRDLISVAFLAKTDNAVASLFVTEIQMNSIEKLLESAKEEDNRHNPTTLSTWSSRVLLLIAMAMPLCVFLMEDLMFFLPSHSIVPCASAFYVIIAFFIFIGPFIIFVVGGIIHFTFDTKSYGSNLAKQVCSVYESYQIAGAAIYSSLVFNFGVAVATHWEDFNPQMHVVAMLLYGFFSDFFRRSINDRNNVLEVIGDHWTKKILIRTGMIVSIIPALVGIFLFILVMTKYIGRKQLEKGP